jgi:hypothetical protein
MKSLLLLSLLALSSIICSCSTSINMPKGTSKGYQSARLIKHNPDADVSTDADAVAREKKVHSMIHSAISKEFSTHGISYGKENSDLTVAYLVMIQNNAITFHYNDYFGRNRDADAIAEYAHLKGAVHTKRNEFFERAIILVDVIDTKTNMLVFRNHYAKDMVDSPTDAQRKQRVQAAVKDALEPFFAQ